MANSVEPDQTVPMGAVCSWSIQFASIVMQGKYLQQTTSADDIFRCIFTWRFKGNLSLQRNWLGNTKKRITTTNSHFFFMFLRHTSPL